jgi:beta-barrel assembly-enhancing protease
MAGRLFILIISVLAFAGCDVSINGTPDPKPKTMTYSYACIDSAVAGSKVNKTIGRAGDLIRDIAIKDKEVTDEVQNEYGESFHKDAIDTKMFTLMKDPSLQQQLNQVLSELLEVRKSPSAIKYFIYPLEDTVVNAFTFGGRIYITRAMLEKTKGRPALLYAIIGHEIGHSEKGHIKKTIQEMLLSEKIFGESGVTVFQIKRLLTGSFNQKNELEADYYGTDLAYALDQDVCAAVVFWKEMSALENKYNQLEDFFRSHPFSSLRAQCLENHIRDNFEKSCYKK